LIFKLRHTQLITVYLSVANQFVGLYTELSVIKMQRRGLSLLCYFIVSHRIFDPTNLRGNIFMTKSSCGNCIAEYTTKVGDIDYIYLVFGTF